MNCNQKSGVFLNLVCNNTSEKKCTNCKKNICESHAHIFETKILCEDCYWETYLYTVTQEKMDYYDESTFHSGNTYTGTSNSSDANIPTDSGFDEGFGGGGFGGGGATSSWSEGDIESVNNNINAEGNTFLDNDETFFYS